jgi:hypothetical protein
VFGDVKPPTGFDGRFIGYGWGGVAIAGMIAYSTTLLDKHWFPEDSESKPAAADPH